MSFREFYGWVLIIGATICLSLISFNTIEDVNLVKFVIAIVSLIAGVILVK